MICLPGVLSQGGRKYTWGRYALKKAVVEGTRSSDDIGTGYTTSFTKGYVFHEDTGLFDLEEASYVQGQTDDYVSLGVGAVVYSPYNTNNLFYKHQLTGHSKIYKKTISEITTSGDASTIYFDIVELKAGSVKGEYIDTVEASDPSAYPDNGKQGNYWYIKYADTPITWERYNFSWAEIQGASVTQSVSSGTTFYRATTYSKEDGLFKATGTSTRASSLAVNNLLIQNDGAFVNSTNLSGDTLCKITSKTGYNTISLKYDTFTLAEERGSYIDTVTSYNPYEFPDDGVQDGYWYVKV